MLSPLFIANKLHNLSSYEVQQECSALANMITDRDCGSKYYVKDQDYLKSSSRRFI
jgi:hypothetical protein